MNHKKAQSSNTRIQSYIPQSFLSFKEGYTWQRLRKDLFAGISVGIIAFPIALAVAMGANVSPERALFTAIIGGFLISFLGGSRVQIGGPTSTLIVIMFGVTLNFGFDAMLLATLMAGIILVIFGLAGLGTYFKYIPYPVVTGLTTGIAVIIFTTQLKEFLGLRMGQCPIDFIGRWQGYWNHISTFNPLSTLIGCATLAIIIYLRKIRPHWPGVLIALAAAGLVTWAFNLNIDTIASRYGNLRKTVPTLTFPTFHFGLMLDLIPASMTIALLAGIESLLAAVVAEGMTGWRHRSNCELVAQGIANIGTALFGGIPATGSLSRTAANIKAGASTPLSGMIHAVVILLIFILFGPLVTKLPLCSLAAVLFIIAWNMSEIHHFLHLFTAPKKDILVLITVFLLTVFVDITSAVQIGMVLAAFLFMKQMSDLSDVVSVAQVFDDSGKLPDALADPDALSKKEIPEGVEVYEINGPFFFGVADRLKNLLNELERPPKIFILRMRRVPAIDASGMHALEEFYYECKRQKSILLLSGVKKLPLKDLKRYHLDELIGQDHIFSHINQALEFAKELLRVEAFKKAMKS